MQYPNSIISRAGGAARPSPVPAAPVPRPKPSPAAPRRKPGRPAPQRPRRPPTAPQRPAPAPQRPGPVRPNPTKPGRFPDRTPGLPYRNPPKVPPIFKPLPWLGVGVGLFYTLTKPAGPWDVGDTVGPWILYKRCDPPAADSTPFMVSHRMYGQTAGMTIIENCYNNQAGFWDGVSVNPGPPWAEASPGDTSRTRNRVVLQFVGSLSHFARAHSVYTWYRRHTNAAGGIAGIDGPPYFNGPNALTPQPGPYKTPPSAVPAPLPDAAPGPWWAPFFPPWFAPGQVPHNPAAPPVQWPAQRPEPWSPEAPDVGPRPEPNPQPAPQPDKVPVPEIVPEVFPEVIWVPAPYVPQVSISPRGTKAQPRPQEKRVRRPPRGTKERKVRFTPLMSFLWNSFNPITEGIDMINFMYECLPWKLKVEQYKKRGRQPNPGEKVGLIYQNINSLDVGCAVNSYIKEQLEDMLYALGSSAAGNAAKKDDRPIGYEAGGSLTGGGEYVDTGSLGAPPPGWPEFLPW